MLFELGRKREAMSSNNQTIADRLAAHPFLKGMAMEHIKVLAQSAVPTHFEKGQVIFKAGEPANGLPDRNRKRCS